ncbi:MAG: cell division protein FtsZ [Bacteroidales bacterium]|nr:cell division protein FtsZ [Bacteroidales bacterium]
MDENTNSTLLAFDCPQNQSSYIKVIGVGGGGNNAVNHMFRKGITGVDFIVSNTDMKALNGSPVPNKLVLGHEGLGVGGRPERAKKAAEEKEKEIRDLLSQNTKMVFITAGMGGGTGTGAAPVIARIAKEIELNSEDDDIPGKILVVAVVTTPFKFEGTHRLRQAQEGVNELRKYVDSILVINNEKLRSYGNLIMSEAFSMANDVLLTAVKGIAEIITLNATINIDFRDVHTVMENSGTALMGIGQGTGEDRAQKAVEEATTSVLLDDNDITGAKDVLLYFSCGREQEISMDEVGLVTDYINQKTGSFDTNVIFGIGYDDNLNDEIKITLIATGFSQKSENVALGGQVRDVPTLPKPDAPSTHPGDTTRSTEPGSSQTVPPSNPTTSDNTKDSGASSKPHVIPLYSDQESRPTRKEPENDSLDGIQIISHNGNATQPAAPQPAPTPAPAPAVQTIETPRPSTAPITSVSQHSFQSSNVSVQQHTFTPEDIQVMNRADRIKALHDMLRYNPNGAQYIEAIDPLTLSDDKLFVTTPSSESDAEASMNSDGSIRPNPTLYKLPD